jgi:hypothetical protein
MLLTHLFLDSVKKGLSKSNFHSPALFLKHFSMISVWMALEFSESNHSTMCG